VRFLKSRDISKQLEKASKDGFNRGKKYAERMAELEKQQIRDDYSMIELDLKTQIKVLEDQIDSLVELEKDSKEKMRKANTKILQAQEIVLRVQQVLNTISESASRGGADISQIRLDIERPVKQIMKEVQQ
jgi:hypothetical protein